MSLKYYFSYKTFIRKNIAEIFFNDYGVTNVFDNDRFAIITRIDLIINLIMIIEILRTIFA